MKHQSANRLSDWAWLSVGAAIVTMGLKTWAWQITGSVGLLADAAESLVNLLAALLAVVLLRLSARPPDDQHAFGHDKAEFFGAAVEGGLIVVAAGAIVWHAVQAMLEPRPPTRLDLGLALAVAAATVNLVVGRTLRAVGRRHRSPTLIANGTHLLSDVWTTTGVIAGLLASRLTGWVILDPIVALVLALHIGREGALLVWGAWDGLMDRSIEPSELMRIHRVLDALNKSEIQYHALRTRRSASRNFAQFHLLVPGDWSVRRGHELCETLESDLRREVPGLVIVIHLEPIDVDSSWLDVDLDERPPRT